jgi:hypothetical protein
LDVGARKDFSIGKSSLELSIDVINLLNSDALFVERVVNGNTVAVRRTGRQFQLGARLAF